MHFLKRILMMVPLLLVISFLAFLLLRLAPGGPFDRERQASPDIERNLKARYHLDKPVLVQYGYFLRDLLRGDLGPSLKYRSHSVNDVIAQGLPVSLTLGALAFLFAMGLGIPMGVLSAWKAGTRWDHFLSFLALLAVCIPGFILGPLLVMFFGVKLQWFPVVLWESPWHVVLPVVSLGFYFAGKIARLTRQGVEEVLRQDFILTARAKGLSEGAILRKHVLRLGILPIVSYAGPLLADLLTGSFVVENIFQIPGIGVFMVNSSTNRDYPMVIGLVLLYAVMLLLFNLLADFVQARLDPRIRHE